MPERSSSGKKPDNESNFWVEVTIKIPRPLHEFTSKLAALEATKAEDWYAHWIRRDFEAMVDHLKGCEINFSIERIIEHNDLRETLEDINPGILARLLGGD
jgi:hypothetical protein